jgi:predicted nuclease of predicted toxin-antitoxin system
MKLRFQADNDLDQRIVIATRRLDPSIDFQTAPALGLHNLSDEEVLALTAQQGRVLVTHDRRTMRDHFARHIEKGTTPGVIIVSWKLPVGRAAEWLHLLWAASEAEEYVDSIYSIP